MTPADAIGRVLDAAEVSPTDIINALCEAGYKIVPDGPTFLGTIDTTLPGVSPQPNSFDPT